MMNEVVESKVDNRCIADIFHKMASCYRYLGAEHRFRAIAYDTASRTIQGLKENIGTYAHDVKTLDKLYGIGEHIAGKIIEYLDTGKIETYEQLKKQVPEGLLELMDIAGFGPATAKILYDKVGISDKRSLLQALEEGKLEGLKGFGHKKIENLLRGLKLYKQGKERMLLSEALEAGNTLLAGIKKIPGVINAALAGSLRRRKETIGDIDIVACADRKEWKRIMTRILKFAMVERVVAKGETKTSFLLRHTALQVDIRLVNEHEYGAALLYFTGCKEHNVKLRTWAKGRGWKLSEYGLFDAKTGKLLADKTEEEIFEWFDIQYIPPEMREDKGEIELAREYKLSPLVTVKDIKGDMQMHSKWSDGTEDIETIAKYVMKEFPHYQYIVITDHSPSQRVAGGCSADDFKEQFIEIDNINKAIGKSFIKKGVEVDILADGSLDLPDDVLAQFDWVVASIHTGFNRDNTDRLIKACQNPFVNCIGHPSGRLIGKREAYPVDWRLLFEKLVSTRTAIEINAQPERLDLTDDLVRAAIKQGVTITISTDSHMLTQFQWMEYGVGVARRGWCKKSNILNTGSWHAVEVFKQRKASLHLHAEPVL